ncbi:MAG: S24 family peptidase [Phycisphaeraceae bacterium]
MAGQPATDSSMGALLRRLRRERGLTLACLADRVGITPGYLSMIENRRVDNPPSMKVVVKLEAALGVRDARLCRAAQWERTPGPIREELERSRRRWAGPGGSAGAIGPAVARVPLINKVAAGYPTGFTDLGYPAGVGDDAVLVPGYTGLHGANDPDAFAATVCGDSMLPEYRAGDVVVFSPLADVVDGSDCFARLEPDHESTFKRVFFDHDADTIRLEPLNRDYPTRTVARDQVAGLFRAVWRMSRL